MRLADFIRANMAPILKEWEEFAETILPGDTIDKAGLLDHAKQMIEFIVVDLCKAESETEKDEKSKGKGAFENQGKASEEHGVGRQEVGFSIGDTISEFRALRASVLALWSKSNPAFAQSDLEDVTRFNEAIDQAIAESIASFSAEKHRQNRVFETILAASPDQIYILDLDGRITYANKAKAELYGMSPDTIKGKNYFDLNFTFAPELQQHIEQVIATGKIYRGELSNWVTTAQDELQFEYILAPVLNDKDKVEAVVGITRDITERKAVEQQSWHNANYDQLTSIPNRRLFQDRLEQDINHSARNGLPIALMFIDLDNFKEVNDLLGHETGDILLREAAGRITACVRTTDTVARLGGDEFTVIVSDIIDTNSLGMIAQKIIESLTRPFHILGEVVNITGSIGITHFPQDAATPEDLLKNADQAMYAAKNAGRNQVSFFARH